MPILLLAYILVSLIFALTGWWRAGPMVGFYTLMTAALFVVSGVRLKQLARVKWGRDQPADSRRDLMVAGVIFAIVLAGLAQWLSVGFTIRVADYSFAASIWGWLGFVVAFLVF